MRCSVILLLIVLISACGGQPDPDVIIRRSIEAHGGEHLDGVEIGFDFREYHYTLVLDGGRYEYVRERPDSAGYIRDVLNNDGFYREIDGERVALSQDVASSYFSSLNSVAYFMLLPFKLTDAAAQSRYLGTSSIEGESYHEVEVTFQQQGGGRDYQDRFVYWFHTDRYTMDYLAYDYVTSDTGTRFRDAFNERTVGGIRFQDYYNYTSPTINEPGDPIERMDDEFENDELELVSLIESNNITVQPIDQ